MDLLAISRRVFKQEANASHAPFPLFTNCDNIFRQISDTMGDQTRGRWNAPVLNGFLTRDWWDKKKRDAFINAGSSYKESIPGITGNAPA